jgi:hypothetical protein
VIDEVLSIRGRYSDQSGSKLASMVARIQDAD